MKLFLVLNARLNITLKIIHNSGSFKAQEVIEKNPKNSHLRVKQFFK